MGAIQLTADDWQQRVFTTEHRRVILNCSRQAGKSTAAAVLGLATAMVQKRALVLVVSRSLRQSVELFRRVETIIRSSTVEMVKNVSAHELTLVNGSRIVCLPCIADTIRGFSKVDLLIIDEAALVPDSLYQVLRPMLAVSNGQLLALSTPCGRRGWWFEAWHSDKEDWLRMCVPASEISRISPAFLETERKVMGATWYRQEYECSFEMPAGAVYPQWSAALTSGLAHSHRRNPPPWNPDAIDIQQARSRPPGTPTVGGIDFGFRNPFAAIWGYVAEGDVLCITGERYGSGQPLEDHVPHLPRGCLWYCDPSGAGEIVRLRRLDIKAIRGNNAIREGIAAVTGRLQSGRLLIDPDKCPMLAMEGGVYQYDPDESLVSEAPIDRDNHALSALRYLVMGLLRRQPARPSPTASPTAEQQADQARSRRRPLWDNEACWTTLP
jgi:hypothetical protein